MSAFWLMTACVLLGALLCLLLPLVWLAREQEACVAHAFVASVYLGELAAARTALRLGELSKKDYEDVCRDIERRVVADAGAAVAPPVGVHRDDARGDATAVLLIALIPTIVLAIFLQVGELPAPVPVARVDRWMSNGASVSRVASHLMARAPVTAHAPTSRAGRLASQTRASALPVGRAAPQGR
jgi:cytochrome c-type biogenesis protein CcmI